MSLICRMVVGYFDPAQAFRRDAAIDRPLDRDTVQRLQSACYELFGVQLRMADYLTDPGVLVIVGGSINADMFRVACVAHELFGMVAVDEAHRDFVYPRPDWEPQSLEELEEELREFRPDWDETHVRKRAETERNSELERADFERRVMQQVRAARQQMQS